MMVGSLVKNLEVVPPVGGATSKFFAKLPVEESAIKKANHFIWSAVFFIYTKSMQQETKLSE